jgi:hypothetical protein
MDSKKKKKLVIRRETVRKLATLSDSALGRAGGGLAPELRLGPGNEPNTTRYNGTDYC